MEWRKGSNYYLRSDKRYSVSKAFVKDEARYTAWSPDKQIIGRVQYSADSAKELCEDHLTQFELGLL